MKTRDERLLELDLAYENEGEYSEIRSLFVELLDEYENLLHSYKVACSLIPEDKMKGIFSTWNFTT